jgi:uncharacterized lipoprotein YmbA
MNPTLKNGAAGLFIVALCGCASPSNSYYTLSPTEPASARQSNASATIGVGDIQIPAYLDRPQIVVKQTQNRADVREFERWVEPLDGMVRATLLRNLAARLGQSQVIDKSDAAAYLLSVTIEEFGQSDGSVSLRAQWALSHQKDEHATPPHNFAQSIPLNGSGTSDGVAAMSTLIGALSDDIVANIPAR